MVEWTVRELADRAGISPRALRHYHQIGLLVPDRIGANGYRHYGPTAVARLQRILLLRNAGLSLTDIKAVLADEADHGVEVEALEAHLTRLRRDQDALARRIAAVEHTLVMRRAGRQPRVDMVLEGFNDRYEDEVAQRWGREVFLARWGELYDQGIAPTDTTAQDHAAVHTAWFAQIPGTPAHVGDTAKTRAMLHGMANLYATSSDFHPAFGGAEAAAFAAQALHRYTDEHYPK